MTVEADLIVVGYGAAGVAAAITAARLGARVALIDKQPADAHYSSTRMSGGLYMGARDVYTAARYLDACSGGMIPAAVSRLGRARGAGYGLAAERRHRLGAHGGRLASGPGRFRDHRGLWPGPARRRSRHGQG